MNENKALAVYDTCKGKVELTVPAIKALCPNATTQELEVFAKHCYYYKANPYLKEAMLVKYAADQPASIIFSWHWYNAQAKKNPHYKFCLSGLLGADGNRLPVTTPKEKVAGAWAEVWFDNSEKPATKEVALEEYIQITRDGKPNRTWTKMLKTMIQKVAKSQALREAMPDIYGPDTMTAEEMGFHETDEGVIEAEVKHISEPSEPQEDTEEGRGLVCPACEHETVFLRTRESQKTGKPYERWECSRFPDCKWNSFDKPEEAKPEPDNAFKTAEDNEKREAVFFNWAYREKKWKMPDLLKELNSFYGREEDSIGRFTLDEKEDLMKAMTQK
jgi:phage recombination protein Bet